MKVQTFFYCLKELNDYVNWLPGEEPALTDAQLNLAFLQWNDRIVARVLCHFETVYNVCQATSLFPCSRTRTDGQGQGGKEKCQTSQGIQEWVKLCTVTWAIQRTHEE
jgi:hypothetical protein